MLQSQIESFDQFLHEMLPHIIQENSEIVVDHTPDTKSDHQHVERHRLVINKGHATHPSHTEHNGLVRRITPAEARGRNLTYESCVCADITHYIEHVNHKEDTVEVKRKQKFSRMLIARIPMMVNSSMCNTRIDPDPTDQCWFDQGGYFVVNGVEKGFVSQEKLRINHPFIFSQKVNGKQAAVCEVRSCHERKLRSTSTMYISVVDVERIAEKPLTITIPFVHTSIPMSWLFCLFGVNDRDQMLDMIRSPDDPPALVDLLETVVTRQDFSLTQAEIVSHLCKSKKDNTTLSISHVEHILTNEVLPHIGLDTEPSTVELKARFLAHCVRCLVRTSGGYLPYMDRDHYSSKRIDTAGALMSLLFRQLYRSFLKTITIQLNRFVRNPRVDNVSSFVSHKKITNGFRYAFATGNWGIQKNSPTQMGTVQVLSRMTSLSPTSALMRINTPLCREGKNPKPRQLHMSSWGLVCAAETPEGPACGLMKNLCLSVRVRVGVDTHIVWDNLRRHPPPCGFAEDRFDRRAVPIFLNGIWIAAVSKGDVAAFVDQTRRLKRSQIIPFDSTVAFRAEIPCVCITTDRGALCRPLIVADRLDDLRSITGEFKDTLTPLLWRELIAKGIVEYMDKEEEEEMRVAINWGQVEDAPGQWTHCEIHPTLINGMSASQIPFSDHNQAPRNCYQSAMGKQAIGVYATNFHQRVDNSAHVLCNPQRPLVTTWTDDILQTKYVSSGINAMVAIMCWGGYNQEDSLILNRTSLENGMFGSTLYRTFREETKPNPSDVETFEFPEHGACSSMKIGCYDKLNHQAVAPVGTKVSNGDVIIGKTVASKQGSGSHQRTTKRDNSMCVKGTGRVDMILSCYGESRTKQEKVRVRQHRVPRIGDKLASRHGQKGVIGIVYDEKDMPFTESGLRPDIIVNPHAIPSRMTIGMLLEMLLGKECLLSGNLGDGTPFRGTSVSEIGDMLEGHGESRDGTESMFNAYTGERMRARVFLAPAYYQRLKHMVEDKIHARSRGPLQLLTRQPNEGRSKDGGLRFGEMERDCLVAHGCSAVLKECLCDKSDPYITVVCSNCGILCEPYHNQRPTDSDSATPVGYCRMCDDCTSAQVVRMPYAMKLLIQEMQAMHVLARFRFERTGTEDGISVVEPCVDFV